jgi:hypothetical protein
MNLNWPSQAHGSFDIGASRRQDESMLPKLRAVRHFAFVIVFAFAFAPVATCLAAVAAAAPEMPCHGSVPQPTPERSAHLDCCPGDSPNSQGSTPVQQVVDASAPTPVLVAVLLPAVDIVGRRAGLVDCSAGTSKPPGIPTYVFVSSFRI